MKSKLECKDNEINFPKLMISSKDLIVLFTEPEIGTVVFSSNGLHSVGEHYEGWLMPNFKDFNGVVELSN